jgi:phospholipid/cholesterol/gamma-HCH transport system substrate-binding protein
MNKSRTVVLGLFFLATLGVLAYYTLFQAEVDFFKKPNLLTIYFAQANGLRKGDSVTVDGMRWGKVKDLTYDSEATDPKRRIRVVTSLNDRIHLRRGFQIRIEDATLLGGKNLSIQPGPIDGEYIDPNVETLYGEVGKNPLASLGDLVADSQRGVSKIIEDLAAITSSVRGGKGPLGRVVSDEKMAEDLAQTLQNAASTLASLDKVAKDLAAGRGTAGELLTNRELYDELLGMAKKLNATLDQTAGLVGDFRQGKGALPLLFTDEKVAKDLAGIVANFGTIVARVERGEGTVGTLLKDDTIAKDVASITHKIAEGEGTIGALVAKNEIYDSLYEITENFAVITGAVRNGQGSIGRLVMDDEIYQEIKSALLIVQRAIEEYREAAPVTTFTSVFFGAF